MRVNGVCLGDGLGEWSSGRMTAAEAFFNTSTSEADWRVLARASAAPQAVRYVEIFTTCGGASAASFVKLTGDDAS